MAIYDRTSGGLTPGRAWMSRTKQRIANTLGIIDAGQMNAVRKFRNPALDIYDAYYESRQYADKIPWNDANKQEEYVAVRDRQPRVIYNLAKVLIDRVAAKLVGQDVWPQFVIEDDPDDTDFLRIVQKISNLKSKIMEPVKHMLLTGSSFVRYYLVDGNIKLESYNAKYCYPEFQPSGELESVSIKYVYEDTSDLDRNGNPKPKWYRLDLGLNADVLFDNPDYKEGSEPEFTPVETTSHGLGWVQGEWLKIGDDLHSPDGPSLIADVLEFIDEFNYSLSQSSQATGYNQEPQLTLSTMDEDEIDKLIRSSSKAWNLGREGKAEFLETDLKGIEAASALRDHMKEHVMDIVRVLFLDPEKLAGAAQSGKAMEIMHGPFVELINELRPMVEIRIRNLLIKIGMTLLVLDKAGVPTALVVPPGYMPKSMDVSVIWPPLFAPTIQDLQAKVTAAVAVANANIISRETLTRWLAKDFGVEDIDEEISKIASQPVMNPFGTPFGG